MPQTEIDLLMFTINTLNDKIDGIEKKQDDTNIWVRTINSKVSDIQYKIENVQCNGRKGLNESMQDIYNKVGELNAEKKKEILNIPIKDFLFHSGWVSKLFWSAIILVVTNIIFVAFGAKITLGTLIQMLF